jgi:hypothetical protein
MTGSGVGVGIGLGRDEAGFEYVCMCVLHVVIT